ncbi:MAG: hypothetical protein ABIV48_09985 [Pyrinomonadaceae bacterium]
MGKLVKFCSACDEGFAERFGFCPNCGQTLQVFEMKPIVAETPVLDEPISEPVSALELESIEEPAEMLAEEPVEPESIEDPILEVPMSAEPIEETPAVEEPKAKAAAVPAAAYVQTKPVDVDRKPVSPEKMRSAAVLDDGFHVTVIEEKKCGAETGFAGRNSRGDGGCFDERICIQPV